MAESEIKGALQATLDPIEASSSPPDHLLKKARRRRWMVGVSGFLSVLIIGAGIAAGVSAVQPPTEAAFPSQQQLRDSGFAVWPEDTVDEAKEECAEGHDWRFDSEQTALRFATNVLEFPQPKLTSLSEEGAGPNKAAYILDTGGVKESLFSASTVQLQRYGRCWYIVQAEPRDDGGFFPYLGFTREGERTQLIVSYFGVVEVGYGRWSERLDPSNSQVVLDLPDLEPDATGHVMSLAESGGAFSVAARPLGFVPEPATSGVTPLTPKELAETPEACIREDSYRSPRAALGDYYIFRFDAPAEVRYGNWRFPGKNAHVERLDGDLWRLKVDDAVLTARVPNLRSGCWQIASIVDPQRIPIESLFANGNTLTFDLDWGEATGVGITIGTARGGEAWGFDKLDRPITLSMSNQDAGSLDDEPLRVTVVLRKGNRVTSAQHGWYRSSRT